MEMVFNYTKDDFTYINHVQYGYVFKTFKDNVLHFVCDFFVADITYKMCYLCKEKALDLYIKNGKIKTYKR